MNVLKSTLITNTAQLGLLVLSLSILLVLCRIILGPKNADRIIGLDLLSVLVVAMVALYGVFSKNAVFLDVAIVSALVAFLGTVAFARYIERSAENETAQSKRRRKEKEYD